MPFAFHQSQTGRRISDPSLVNLQFSPCLRLSRQLLEVVEEEITWDSLDERYWTYSVLPDLSDSYWPYGSTAVFSPEELEVSSALEMASEYSAVRVIKLQLDCPVHLLVFVPHTCAVLC